MKEKILAALKIRFPKVHAELLDRVAGTLASTVTDESTIETVVQSDGVNNLVSFHITETDRRATEAANKRETTLKDKYNLVEKKVENPKPVIPDDAPDWAKAIIKKNEELEARLATKDKKENHETYLSTVKSKLIEKGLKEEDINDFNLLSGLSVNSEDEIDGLVASVETKFNESKQNLINRGVVVDVPINSQVTPDAVEADIEAWAGKK